MLQPNFDGESNNGTWQDLEHGAPTVSGFASLCSRSIAAVNSPSVDLESLSIEARTILFAARDIGVIEIRGNKNAFSPADRFLAVCIPISEDSRLVFKQKSNPRQTVAFLEGFRQLCLSGLIIHHLQLDFSLTSPGFELASTIAKDDVQESLEFANDELL